LGKKTGMDGGEERKQGDESIHFVNGEGGGDWVKRTSFAKSPSKKGFGWEGRAEKCFFLVTGYWGGTGGGNHPLMVREHGSPE